MRQLATFAFALALTSPLVACGDDQQPEQAADLWTRIGEAEVEANWARAPGYEKRRESSQPHGDNVEIFVNDVVEGALAAEPGLTEWPEGSWIVKNGYHDDGELDVVTSMEKRADGWFWAEFSAEGESLYSGKPGVCTGCHESGSDFVRAFVLPRK